MTHTSSAPTHVSQYHDALARLRADPLTLTEKDFAVLDEYGGPHQVAQARAAVADRQKALAGPAAPRRNLMEQMAEVVGMSMKTVMSPVVERLKMVEAGLAALEAKPHVKFVGVWAADREYQPGDAVVHASALWHCKAATKGAPDVDFVGWQLVIKSPPRK